MDSQNPLKHDGEDLDIITKYTFLGPALSTRGNLARARARGAGSPRTVEHRYLPSLGRYKTLMMRAKD